MELDSWNSSPGPTPAVDPDDLRKVWEYMLTVPESHGTGITLFQSICNPGADVFAVWYRASILGLCEHLGLLSRWKDKGTLDSAVFKVAADYKIDKMPTGIVQKSPPLDIDGFLKRIEAESAKAGT
jgi:hypothetical protein